MKTVADLVRGGLRKAESDLTTAELCLETGGRWMWFAFTLSRRPRST